MHLSTKDRWAAGRFILLLMCVIFWGTLAGCDRRSSNDKKNGAAELAEGKGGRSSAKPSKKDFNIGVLYWSMNIQGQVAMRKGLERRAAEINASNKYGVKLNLIARVAGDGDKGMERQVGQMYGLIDDNVDLIIVQPTDVAALSGALKKANEQGIPVVAYDQYIIGGKLASYITSDNYQAGYLDGEYIASKFKDDYKIRIILVEYPHVSSTVQRVNGFMDALDQQGQSYEILKTYNAVEPVGGAKAGEEILKDYPGKGSFDVVFTVNDGGGLPIVEALTKAGRTEVMAATIDGDPVSVDIIKSGGITKIDSAQFCGPMGAEAMNVAYKILMGQNVPNHILIPVFPVTSETMKIYTGWMGPLPKCFKKPWPSKHPYWKGDIKVVKPEDDKAF